MHRDCAPPEPPRDARKQAGVRRYPNGRPSL